MKSIARHGDNIICGTLAHGDRRTEIVGVYIPPLDKEDTIRELDEVMRTKRWKDTVLLEDLNVNFKKPKDN